MLGAVLAVAISVAAQGELVVAFYQRVKKPKITVCVDTFGALTIYEGSLIDHGALTPAKYSMCIESTKSRKDMEKALDYVAALYSFGAINR